jgi:hypothetical protein
MIASPARQAFLDAWSQYHGPVHSRRMAVREKRLHIAWVLGRARDHLHSHVYSEDLQADWERARAEHRAWKAARKTAREERRVEIQKEKAEREERRRERDAWKANGPYVTKSTLLRGYGFTPKLIDELGAADGECTNPHARSAAPMRLYSVPRVNRFIAEHKTDFESAIARRPGRQDAAKRAVATKTRVLCESAEQVNLQVGNLPPLRELEARASAHASGRHGADAREPGYKGICATIRHEFTNYDAILEKLRGQIGKGKAYEIIRRRLDEQIEEIMDSVRAQRDSKRMM